MTQQLHVNDNGTWKPLSHCYNNTGKLSYVGNPRFMFDFESLSGGKPIDITGNTPSSSMQWDSSLVAAAESTRGKIADFASNTSGSLLVIDNPYGAIDLATSDCTIFAWIWLNSNANTGTNTIFRVFNEGLVVQVYNGSWRIYVKNTAETSYVATSTLDTVYNAWIPITATWEFATKIARLFVGMKKVAHVTLVGTPKNCTATVLSWSGTEYIRGYADDWRMYDERYNLTGSGCDGRSINLLANGRSVWQEADKVYVNDAGTWKKSHEKPYIGNAFVDLPLNSHTGTGNTHGDVFYNESIQDHTSFTLYKNASSLTYAYRGGNPYLGYKLTSVVGGTFSLSGNIPDIDLNSTSCTLSCWANPLNYNGVQRLITLGPEAMVLRFANNRVNIYMFNDAGTYYGGNSSTITLGWWFLVMTWDHVTKTMTAYSYNGADRSVTTVNQLYTTTLSGNARTVTTMDISSNGSESLEGSIIMPRLHKRVVPVVEIPYLAREF